MPEAPAWKFQHLLQDLAINKPISAILTGRIITAVNDSVIDDGYIIIESGLIKEVGPDPAKRLAEGTNGLDIIKTSGTILPGIINSHAHLGWDGIHDLAGQALHDTPEVSAYKCASNMIASLKSGTTTVRDLGMNQTGFFAKQAVEQGLFTGPRLLICGEAITQTGGHTYWCCREASGATDMRRAVREQVMRGADLIKIMTCHDNIELTDAELEAVIDEAHLQKLPITAHATFDAAIARAVNFGIDVIEHGGSMTDKTIETLLEKNTPIVTTFSPLLMQSQPEVARQYNIPEWKIKERQAAVADKNRFAGMVKAAKAGVRMVFGTDSGSPVVRHGTVVPELEFMVSMGVVENNHKAIMSATREAAILNRIDDQVGSLVVGKEADLVVVEGNPVNDLQALSNIQMVFLKGARVA